MKERYSKARFWKCALQVNPAGYIRYRREDHGLGEDEYNRKLVEICKEQSIKIIGLADHGNVECIDGIRSLFKESGDIRGILFQNPREPVENMMSGRYRNRIFRSSQCRYRIEGNKET